MGVQLGGGRPWGNKKHILATAGPGGEWGPGGPGLRLWELSWYWLGVQRWGRWDRG